VLRLPEDLRLLDRVVPARSAPAHSTGPPLGRRWSRLVGVLRVRGGDLDDFGSVHTCSYQGPQLVVGLRVGRGLGPLTVRQATVDVGPWCAAVCSVPIGIKVAEPRSDMGRYARVWDGILRMWLQCSACGIGPISWTAAGASRAEAVVGRFARRQRDAAQRPSRQSPVWAWPVAHWMTPDAGADERPPSGRSAASCVDGISNVDDVLDTYTALSYGHLSSAHQTSRPSRGRYSVMKKRVRAPPSR
jgi:hypothetical protein